MKKILIKSFLFFFLLLLSAYITISIFIRSTDFVIVPDVCKLHFQEAASLLSERGLKVQKKFSHSILEEGYVISQYPPPHTKVKEGRRIVLIISKGPKKYIIPSVIGKKVEDAKEILRKAGILHYRISYIYWNMEKDTIIAQNPEGGRTINEAQIVKLLVSKGPLEEKYVESFI